MLLSNKASMKPAAKYQLMHALRTHHGQDDTGYNCMAHAADKAGNMGIYLSKVGCGVRYTI